MEEKNALCSYVEYSHQLLFFLDSNTISFFVLDFLWTLHTSKLSDWQYCRVRDPLHLTFGIMQTSLRSATSEPHLFTLNICPLHNTYAAFWKRKYVWRSGGGRRGGGERPSLTQFNCRSVKHLTRWWTKWHQQALLRNDILEQNKHNFLLDWRMNLVTKAK